MNIAILGCGKMGSAFAYHLAKKGSLLLCSRNEKNLEEIANKTQARTSSSPKEAYAFADVVFLGIKPKDLVKIQKSITSDASSRKIILSMLAGVTLDELSKVFTHDDVVRIMPNLPIKISKGIIACAAKSSFADQKKNIVDDLLAEFGKIVWGSEKKLDAITAIASSGIAYVSYFIDAMISSAQELGLSHDLSRDLVFETFYGTLKLLEEEKISPAKLIQNVASPGGCTSEGLKVKDAHQVKETIVHAILKTYEKLKSH